MTAHSLEQVVSTLALQNHSLLQGLYDGGHKTVVALAASISRDKSNVAKSLKALEEADLVWRPDDGFWSLTVSGIDALGALGRLAGEGAGEPRSPEPTPAELDGLVVLRHVQIAPDPDNPRRDFDSEEAREGLEELAQSIYDAGELLQNLVVRPHPAPVEGGPAYMLVAGERRWRSVGLLIEKGLWTAEAAIPAKVRAMSEIQARRWALIENLKRVDLKPLEEARSFKQLVDSGMSTQEIALEVLGNQTKQRYVQQRIQLLDLDPEIQRQVDAKALTIKDALDLLRHGEIRPKEEASPVSAAEDLEPHQVLALVEIQAAANIRPAKDDLGPAAAFDAWDFKPKEWPPEWELAQAGYIKFDQGRVVLLRPAQQFLGRLIFTMLDAPTRLRKAREEVGLDEEAIAELEASETFDRSWLNERNPPERLSAAEALVLLELIDAQAGERWVGAEIAPDTDSPLVRTLAERGLVHGPSKRAHRTHLRAEWKAEKALERICPDFAKKSVRKAHLARLRAEVLGAADAAQLGKRYATPWLNGPFELPPGIQAQIDRDKAAQSEQERIAEERRQAQEALAARKEEAVDRLAAEAPTLTPDDLRARLVEVLRLIGAPAPWRPSSNRYYGLAEAANGFTVESHGDLVRRLLVLALNMAAGVDLRAAAEPAPPVDRAAFVGRVAEALKEIMIGWKEERCRAKAGHLVDDYCREGGIAFGDADVAWTADTANEIASDFYDQMDEGEEAAEPDGDHAFTEDEED